MTPPYRSWSDKQRSLSWFAALILCLALAHTAGAAGPGNGMALADLQLEAGADAGPVTARVRVDGATRRTQVVLFHRPTSQQDFDRQEMMAVHPGLYTADLQGVGEATDVLECYVLAMNGDSFVTLGSQDEPLTVSVTRRNGPPPVLPLALAGSALVLGSLTALVLRSRRRRRRKIWKDETFWDRIFGNLLEASGPELSGRITDMSREVLAHPRFGTMRWGRAQLFEKVKELRARDGDALAALKRKGAPAGAANVAQVAGKARRPSVPSAAAPPPPVPYRDPTLPGWVAEELHSLLTQIASQQEESRQGDEAEVTVVRPRPAAARPAAGRPDGSPGGPSRSHA